MTECGPGVAVRPEVESGFAAGTGPEPGDGVGFGSGAAAEAVFGPETEPEAVTEPGVVVGPEAVAEPEVGFAAVFEKTRVPAGTEVGPLVGVGPGAKFWFGTETAPEVESEEGTVLGFVVAAEPAAEFAPEAETEL